MIRRNDDPPRETHAVEITGYVTPVPTDRMVFWTEDDTIVMVMDEPEGVERKVCDHAWNDELSDYDNFRLAAAAYEAAR